MCKQFYTLIIINALFSLIVSGCVSLDKKYLELPVEAPLVLYPAAANLRKADLKDILVQTDKTIADIPIRTQTIRMVSQQINTAVVSIYTKTSTPYRVRLLPFRIPGTGLKLELPGQSLGSGFIIHPSGYLLTNDHVVQDAVQIRALTQKGEDFPLILIARDPNYDLALLKIISPPRRFPVLPMGDSNLVDVGDFVIAAGNPLGLGHTITLGIISQTGRTLFGLEEGRQISFLQTDTAINSGSSGGPLITITGAWVGVNTAIASGAQGIGFAVPSRQSLEFLKNVIAGRGISADQL